MHITSNKMPYHVFCKRLKFSLISCLVFGFCLKKFCMKEAKLSKVLLCLEWLWFNVVWLKSHLFFPVLKADILRSGSDMFFTITIFSKIFVIRCMSHWFLFQYKINDIKNKSLCLHCKIASINFCAKLAYIAKSVRKQILLGKT